MRALAVAILITLLIAVSGMAEQSALSFAVEFAAGTLAAAIPFYAILYRTTEMSLTDEPPRFVEPANEDVLLQLAVTPLVAGATVVSVGWLFGATGKHAGLVSILVASVSELFALRTWDLDLPGWAKVLAVPVITSLGAALGFTLQAGS